MADPNEPAAPAETDQDRNWRKLEERAKNAEETVAKLEREMAFSKAGLDGLTDKQVKALAATHEGDITPEALRATADELGFVVTTDATVSTEAATTASEAQQADKAAEAAQMAKLAASPAPPNLPGVPADGITKQIEEFPGDYQAFQAWVLSNADSILQPGQ